MFEHFSFVDLNNSNAETLNEINGSAPIATEEDSINSSTTTEDEEVTYNGGREESASSTPQFDQSIRSGTPQAKLTMTSQNLRIYQELDNAFSSLDEELKQQNNSSI